MTVRSLLIYHWTFFRQLFVYVFLYLFISTGITGQSPMQKGFDMLEIGSFLDAKEFFKDYLESNPSDKTAQLCYARALGLSGQAQKSTELFNDMLIEYPDDLEIKLNYAESLLWQNLYPKAKLAYEEILQDHPNNFVALLGGANTYSNLKEYLTAELLINRALSVVPDDAGALNSKKFILLGLAADARKSADYDSADGYLSEILSIMPKDRLALLNQAINYILWGKIKQSIPVYEKLLDNDIDSLEGYLGLSYANLLLHNPQKSLNYAQKASKYVDDHIVNNDELVKAKITEINAYGIVGNFRKSFELLDIIKGVASNHLDIELAEARLHLWSRDKEKAKELYSLLYPQNEDVYDVNMNMVDLMRNFKEDSHAQEYLKKSSTIIPNQPDVIRLQNQIDRENSTTMRLEYYRGEDNGGNLSDNMYAQIEFNSYKRWEPFVNFKSRSSYTLQGGQKLSIPRFAAGTNYIINANSSINASIGLAKNTSAEISNGNQLNATLTFKTIVQKHHNFTFKYFTDFQDFTFGLVNEGLSSHNFELNYFATTFRGLGIYSQFMGTTQNDDNTRFLMFISPYYDLKKIPNIKTGFNFLFFQYELQRPIVYFSPSRFYSLEYFLSTENSSNVRAKIIYRAFLALGTQKIEEQLSQSTIRIETSLGYRLSHDLEFTAFYNYSNAAQSSATGFNYTTSGLRLKYHIR